MAYPNKGIDGVTTMTPHGSLIFLAEKFGHNPIDLKVSESDSTEYDAGKPRVLVVDDEKLLADTTAAILRVAGFNAKTAYDGWEGLEVARRFNPDYVITDIMMPMMNGVELAIAIAKTLPGAKIFLFSGQAGISDMLQECQARGYEFPLLTKPVHPLKLIESLKVEQVKRKL